MIFYSCPLMAFIYPSKHPIGNKIGRIVRFYLWIIFHFGRNAELKAQMNCQKGGIFRIKHWKHHLEARILKLITAMGTLEGTLLYVGIPIFSPIPLKFRQLCHIFDVKTRMMSLFGRNFDGLGRKFEFKGGKFELKGRMLSVLSTQPLFLVRNWS